MMFTRNLSKLWSSCALTGVIAAVAGTTWPAGPRDELALQQLQTDFHGASATADYELMLNLWAEDAVFRGGGNVVVGRTAIADFFRNSPGWGTTANLAPTYKSTYEIHGREATVRFECVIVSVDGSSPLTTPLSSLPPGSQNPTSRSSSTARPRSRRSSTRGNG